MKTLNFTQIFFFFVLTINLSCVKQSVEKESVGSIQFYSKDGSENVNKAIELADGGLLFAGRSGNDPFVFILNADGSERVYHHIEDNGPETFHSIIQSKDGGFIAVGGSAVKSKGASPSNTECLAVKLDASLNKTWEITFGGSANDLAFAVQEDDEGNIIVGGYTSDFTARSYLVKLDKNGNKIWTRQHNIGPYASLIRDIKIAPDGTYFIVGINSSGEQTTEVWKFINYSLIVDPATGDIVSGLYYNQPVRETQLNEKGNPPRVTLIKEADGYLIASYWSENFETMNVQLKKVDFSGSSIWTEYYYGLKHAQFFDIVSTEDGYLVVGGSTENDMVSNVGPNSTQSMVLSINKEGEILWSSFIGNTDRLQSARIIITQGNRYRIGGVSIDHLENHQFFSYELNQNGDLINENNE